MAVSVDIFVKDTQVSPAPIQGVVVNVYNSTTLALVTSGTSDSSGHVALLLPGAASPGTNYEVRFFKTGVIFTNPQMIAVLEPVAPPNTNEFDFTGTVVTLPVATDPVMCRCTGRFIDVTGAPIKNQLVRVQALLGTGSLTKPPTEPAPPPPLWPDPPTPPNLLSGFQIPKVLYGDMVASPGVDFRTDSSGRVSFDLPRGGHFTVAFAGEEDVPWCIQVPDRSSVNLIDLIHPNIQTLTWDSGVAPGNTVTVAVNATIEVPFEVLFSNFRTYSKDLGNIITFINSSSLMDVQYNSGQGSLSIRGISAGTASVTVEVIPKMTPPRIPDYSVTYTPLSVVIIP